MPISLQPSPIPDMFARDANIAWFRGEFAAANAIIDALCNHLTQLDCGGSEYESVFAAIHRRRLNWIPVLQMQKYFSIADVAMELRGVVSKKIKQKPIVEKKKADDVRVEVEEEEKELKMVEQNSPSEEEDSSLEGSHEEGQLALESSSICSDHAGCESRRTQIKLTKGFIAKEPVKGQMVNVVKGLKMYDEIFTDSELSKLMQYISELRNAGRNGKLSGETFILFNQQLKGNKRELIQLGVPVFGQIKEGPTCSMEPIPTALQAVIDHLVQWNLIPESRKPNSCIINFFDEGEYSQPYLKPPHLDQPISTLFLSESEMAFGRVLVSDHNGNFKGPLMFSLREGSLLVMRGNSADMAKHVICPSPNKRVSITFFKVRPNTNQIQPSTIPPLTKAMTLWQSGPPQSYGALNGYDPMEVVVPKWGFLHSPVVMLSPMQPIVMSPKGMPRGGTGVFLPWTVGSKKPAKYLPPRAQRNNRLLALPSPMETQGVEVS